MELIKSFKVDHTKHGPGFYVSDEKDGIVTYDLRFCRPNGGKYIGIRALHTIEHLFAAHIRNGGLGPSVIYFGPMGCRTGFYLLVKDAPLANALTETKKALEFIIGYNGKIIGASEAECGNYRCHSLRGAKAECLKYLEIIKQYG